VVVLEDGRRLSAPLVVAADGRARRCARWPASPSRAHETGHVAVVTTVRTELEHGGVARQVFRESGPLAFLPLTVDGRRRYCSIVWSTSPEEAARLVGVAARRPWHMSWRRPSKRAWGQ
jgi:2-polyprenylphenol 6-hydroxylase